MYIRLLTTEGFLIGRIRLRMQPIISAHSDDRIDLSPVVFNAELL